MEKCVWRGSRKTVRAWADFAGFPCSAPWDDIWILHPSSSHPLDPGYCPWAKAGEKGGEGWWAGGPSAGEWWEVNTGPGEGEGEAEEEVGKCKPNVGPGYSQEKQTLAGAWSGAPFRKGRKGWDRCLEKRKKGKKKYKKVGMKCIAWGLGYSPAVSGLVSLALRPVAECVQRTVCSKGWRACMCTWRWDGAKEPQGMQIVLSCVCRSIHQWFGGGGLQ